MNEMTPRERFLAVVNGRQPDRVPTDYWATPELHERVKRELGCADDDALWRRLHVDRIRMYLPAWKLAHHPDDPLAGAWGIRTRNVDYGSGSYLECEHSPLAGVTTSGELRAFRWPDPDDWDYSPVMRALDADDGLYPIGAGSYEPFLLYANMRGREQAFADLAEEPRIAEAALGRIFDFHCEHLRRCFEAGKGRQDIFYLAEDLGAQTGPMFSLGTYRRFFLPNQVRMAELARSYGLHIFYHTDGASSIYLPDLVDVVGIEILNPIQHRCRGMDREKLVRDYGGRIVFHGAIDNQQVLPFGAPEDVAREVRENFEIFNGYRWICAPCHNMQPVTPTANVLALYDTIHEAGGAAAILPSF